MEKRQNTRALQQRYSQREISQVLQIGLATVNRDISYLRNQAKANIKNATALMLSFIAMLMNRSSYAQGEGATVNLNPNILSIEGFSFNGVEVTTPTGQTMTQGACAPSP